MKIIDCRAIAAELLNDETVKKLKGKTILAVMKNHNKDKDNLSYLKSIRNTAAKYGVEVKTYELPAGMSVDSLWGHQKLLPGEMVLFIGYKENEVRELVAASESIPDWTWVLDSPESRDVVEAVILILQSVLGRSLTKPLKTTVIGRSELATKCGFELLKMNHTVTFCHSKTENLKECCKNADVIVSFAGKAGLIQSGMVKSGAIIVSVGCDFVEGRLQGDIDLASMKCREVAVTPTPSGVGLVTTALLFDYLAG